ncbi:hypothetical protein ECTT12B_2259, partial [Escherichia coli TT12B]
RGSDAR